MKIVRCDECGGSGVRSGHAVSPYEASEIACPDCAGEGSWTDEAPVVRQPYVPSAEYAAWCADADSARTTVVHGEPIKRRAA